MIDKNNKIVTIEKVNYNQNANISLQCSHTCHTDLILLKRAFISVFSEPIYSFIYLFCQSFNNKKRSPIAFTVKKLPHFIDTLIKKSDEALNLFADPIFSHKP